MSSKYKNKLSENDSFIVATVFFYVLMRQLNITLNGESNTESNNLYTNIKESIYIAIMELYILYFIGHTAAILSNNPRKKYEQQHPRLFKDSEELKNRIFFYLILPYKHANVPLFNKAKHISLIFENDIPNYLENHFKENISFLLKKAKYNEQAIKRVLDVLFINIEKYIENICLQSEDIYDKLSYQEKEGLLNQSSRIVHNIISMINVEGDYFNNDLEFYRKIDF